jgi:hypothetical protein
MNEILLFIFILFVIIGLNGPNIRAYRLRRLSNKFGLTYEYGEKYVWFKVKNYKRNIINGKIENHDIEFYDIVSGEMKSNGIDDSTFRIDGKMINLQNSPKLLSVREISEKLTSLK